MVTAVSERRRVLMLARQFPPIGGAGVQRSTGTARHLRAYGWEPTIVTGPAGHVDRFNPRDARLLSRIPADVAVHRLEGPEPASRTGMRARVARIAQRDEPWVRFWVDGAKREGARHRADIILASCNPYATAWAGRELSARLGLPWVADLEDPGAMDEMRVHPTGLHRHRDLRVMRAALSTASAIITCAEETAARFRVAMPALADRIVSVPIGYDRDDFDATIATVPDDGALRIVHTGTIHSELGRRHRETSNARRRLGGSAVDVDILTRSHVVIMEAVDRLLEREPALAGRIELVLIGSLTDGDVREIAGRPYVRTPGPMSHEDTVAAMRAASLLFLPMHDVPPGQRVGIVPYKTYEYLAAGRPILAAVPDGDVRDMLTGVSHATLTRPGDVEALTAALGAAVKAGPASSAPAPEMLERRHMVGRIAEVLDQVVGDAARAGASARGASRSSASR